MYYFIVRLHEYTGETQAQIPQRKFVQFLLVHTFPLSALFDYQSCVIDSH